MSEYAHLLPGSSRPRQNHTKTKIFVLVGGFAALTALGLTLLFTGKLPGIDKPFDKGPEDPLDRAYWLLSKTKTPIIDGHIDFPEFTRVVYGNNITAIEANGTLPMHVDIPRLHEGRVGGFFWSCFTECPKEPFLGQGDFLDPTNSVRDTLEQIDVARLLIDKYPETFKFAQTADDVRAAIKEGKIASLLGIEGAHQLGNSLASIRAYAALGVKYVTLTHSCHNAFADSAGIFDPPAPLHHGLSDLGRSLIYELNRLGVFVDLSHVSDDTAEQALLLTRAPVIWSHSSSRHFVDIQRNVPDRILKHIGIGQGKVDAVIHVNFAPYFVSPKGEVATTSTVADHVEHIAKVTSKKHVGLGSDYDGIEAGPQGLEDVSKYPNLFAELIRRGWTDEELEGFAGGNTLRVLEGLERVQKEMADEKPSMARYSKRDDIGQGFPTHVASEL